MAQSDRLHHEVEVAQRATVSFTVGLVLVAFVALAVGAAVFDIGKWLTAW
ncbi:MAG: hypothetical protein JO000_16255 [Alphaproteobacteria bacterium]|nr:hypothetical protein [Alphaproteobacteria bacterium]